jgi:hypothetical protein
MIKKPIIIKKRKTNTDQKRTTMIKKPIIIKKRKAIRIKKEQQ